MKRLKRILSGHSGVALITVILIISILVAAALELNRLSRADIYSAANISDGVKLTYIAKSGFYGAAALLINSNNDYETLRDDWAHAEVLSAQSKALFANGSFMVRIEDEKGKIPVNKLVTGGAVNANIKDMLLLLLKQPEFDLNERKAAEIVDAIIDWIDENNEITGAGAESSYYASLAAPYAAKNAPLDCIEELLMIRGITYELFAGTREKPGLGQYVTIYGTGAININTAPKMVLRALTPDITVELADKMDEYRRSKSNNLSSVDWYKKVPGMESITIKPELIEMVKSNYFRIYSTGTADKVEQTISGVMQRSPFQIMSWRQD
ncbi:MAG TPA: type II secretion system minor pseudopilin GspK [Smithellaceae bacterium]|nr:type II secretion system minor pseudopilin GspK [Smithellaceae bacterium]HRY37651.1 type II secretion system minor pseudopilin GspK [Smithellaceae bacterium]